MQALAYTPHLLLVRLLHTSPRCQHKNTITTHGHLALTPEQGAWTEWRRRWRGASELSLIKGTRNAKFYS